MAPELLCGDAEKLNNPWALDVYRCVRINNPLLHLQLAQTSQTLPRGLTAAHHGYNRVRVLQDTGADACAERARGAAVSECCCTRWFPASGP